MDVTEYRGDMLIRPVTKIVMPAGKYWIGDPCYVLKDEHYNKLIEDKNFCHRDNGVCDEIECGFYAELDGHPTVSLYTKYVDGEYDGIVVDSGMIGAVPSMLVNGADDYGHWIEIDEPFNVDCTDDGVLVFGNFSVFTGDTEDEYDDDMEDM